MTAPYTNQLINRVRQDIAYSQARNARIASLGQALQTRMNMPSFTPSSVGGGLGAQVTGGFTDSHGTRLATIVTPWGQHVTVNAAKAPVFAQFLKGLNKLGYHPTSVGGYNYRNIAGTNTCLLYT